MLRGEGGQERLPEPYIIMLDLNMPRMDGAQFLKELRRDPKLTKTIVFVLSTSDDDRDKCAAYREHVAGYLLKSNAGKDFINHLQMIRSFMISVELPPSPKQ